MPTTGETNAQRAQAGRWLAGMACSGRPNLHLNSCVQLST